MKTMTMVVRETTRGFSNLAERIRRNSPRVRRRRALMRAGLIGAGVAGTALAGAAGYRVFRKYRDEVQADSLNEFVESTREEIRAALRSTRWSASEPVGRMREALQSALDKLEQLEQRQPVPSPNGRGAQSKEPEPTASTPTS